MNRMFPFGFFTLLLIFLSPNSNVKSNLSTLNSENYFDFWVGKWEVTWEESEGNMGSGTNHIYKVLDNKVLLENFEVLEGNLKGFKGKSMSVYQTASNRWNQAWADNNGG